MSGKKTIETLARTVRHYGPDGESVVKREVMDVEVTWPGERPPGGRSRGGYIEYGCWEMAEVVEGDDR